MDHGCSGLQRRNETEELKLARNRKAAFSSLSSLSIDKKRKACEMTQERAKEKSNLAESGQTAEGSSDSNQGGVHFAQEVRVHEHRLVLGDNPGVSHGVPLALDWEVDASFRMDLDQMNDHTLSKIPSQQRKIIAEAACPKCVSKVQDEVEATKASREKSSKDPSQPIWKRVPHKVRVPRMFRKKHHYAT